MTKKEMRERVSEWNREIGKARDREDIYFKQLQDLNEKNGDGRRWCSVQKLIEELVKHNAYDWKAQDLVASYYQAQGEFNALILFLQQTKNFDL